VSFPCAEKNSIYQIILSLIEPPKNCQVTENRKYILVAGDVLFGGGS
jgi:hypothetical protein